MFRTDQVRRKQQGFAVFATISKKLSAQISPVVRFAVERGYSSYAGVMGLEHSGEHEELLGERLTDAELQELLTRLGEAQMGGSEESTVGAVVEATGAPALDVALLLAQIRKEDMDRQLAETFGDHEERIDHLETTGRRASTIEAASAPQLSSHEQMLLDRALEKEEFRRTVGPWIAVLLVAIFVIAFLTRNSREPVHSMWREDPGWAVTDPVTGKTFSKAGNVGVVMVDDGPGQGVHWATPEEIKRAEQLRGGRD